MNVKLSKEVVKMIEARTNFEAVVDVDSVINITIHRLMGILNEDATEVLPLWVADKELRELREVVVEIDRNLIIPVKCRNTIKYKKEFVSIMTDVLTALRDLKQPDYRRHMTRLQTMLESYKPKMGKEMALFYDAMNKALEEVKTLDPTLLEEGKEMEWVGKLSLKCTVPQ